MALWEDQDINKPELYAPRQHPRVKKVPLTSQDGGSSPEEYQVMDAEAPAGNDLDFVFDEDPAWNRALPEVKPQEQRRPAKAPAAPRQRVPSGSTNTKPNKSQEKRPTGKGFFGNWFRKKKGSPEEQSKGSPKAAYLYVGIIAGCVLLVSFIIVMMMPQIAGYFWSDLGNYAFVNGEALRYDREIVATYKQYRDYVQRDVIFPGIFVDGVHVGDMTVEEARQALTSQDVSAGDSFSLTVAIGNKTWDFNNSNIPATRDLGNVLERAYAIGRSNTTAIIGTAITPFRQRVDKAMDLRENHVQLRANANYNQDAVRAQVDEIMRYVTREPVNAQIQSFDFNTRSFVFTDEQVGIRVDGEALYQQILSNLDTWQKGVVLTVEPVLAQPTVTKAQLENSFKLVAAFTTDTTGESQRNNNISLACQSINGTVLMPGEVFSFNATTGERTINKGYQEAGAIAGGQTIDEVGGGICQVSSTLFNAVARADLEIVSRSPHAWPSTYVNRGEDATVNWPNLDFKFKNNKSSPVFVITYFKDRKCSAEIWGVSLGEGIAINLQSEITRTMNPPPEVNYVYNPALPYGTQKETVKARTGCVVDTYKVWYKNGNEVKREKMHTSTYKAYQQTVEYNQ